MSALEAGPSHTVGEVAAEAGVAASAVRFYEKHGIVSAVRTSTNQRRFTEGAACRIKVAKVAQRVGLTVREIADVLADLPDDAADEDWRRLAVALVSEARRRVALLEQVLDDLGSGRKLCDLHDADL